DRGGGEEGDPTGDGAGPPVEATCIRARRAARQRRRGRSGSFASIRLLRRRGFGEFVEGLSHVGAAMDEDTRVRLSFRGNGEIAQIDFGFVLTTGVSGTSGSIWERLGTLWNIRTVRGGFVFASEFPPHPHPLP